MKSSFRSNVSANTLQLFLNQGFSLMVFYCLSRALPKEDFGELNWTLAIFLSGFAVASFGFDQMVVRMTAGGENKSELLSVHLFHVAISGFLFYGCILVTSLLFPKFFARHSLILLIGLGKLLIFFSMPFKSIAAGQEKFRLVLLMSISSTMLKGLGIVVLLLVSRLTLTLVVPIFIIADASELAFGFYFTKRSLHLPITLRTSLRRYRQFLKQGLPQLGTVIFSSALARIDWILIGLFLSAPKLAEYSFAYKAFELATLPLLVIAPLLIPLFTRLLQNQSSLLSHTKVRLLLRMEMVTACFTALCLNILWNPLVDSITAGKYGVINTRTILILSLTLPVLYLNNFLWTIHFAAGKLKIIFYSFILCFAVNVVCNLLLIPRLGNEGAAMAIFASTFAQTVFYSLYLPEKFSLGWAPLAVCAFCSLCSGYLATLVTGSKTVLFVLAIACYLLLLRCTIQLRKNDWPIFKKAVLG